MRGAWQASSPMSGSRNGRTFSGRGRRTAATYGGAGMEIFLTVGSQMPFDRLTRAVADWAGTRTGHEVTAQVGHTRLPPERLHPLRWQALMSPQAYVQQCRSADLIVAHAGMGSVLTALELDKPLLMMPRRGALRETRNDHQVATAAHLHGRPGIAIAPDEQALGPLLDRLTSGGFASAARHPVTQGQGLDAEGRPAGSRQALIDHLRHVINRHPA